MIVLISVLSSDLLVGRADDDAPEGLPLICDCLDSGDKARTAHLLGRAVGVGFDAENTDLNKRLGQS